MRRSVHRRRWESSRQSDKNMDKSNTSIDELEQASRAAKERSERASRSLSSDFSFSGKGPAWEEYWRAHREQLSAERALAAARGEEYAIPVDFPAQWDTGAPLPYLLQNDYRTFLTFFVKEHDPNWDGSYVTVRTPSDPSPSRIAVVEFKGCLAAKMGSPNDEVHEGHPWAGRGLDSYTAQEVINSRWLTEIEAINSVHRLYSPEVWKHLYHYVLWFHDSTFECLAESFHVDFHTKNLPDVLAEICRHLME